MERTLPAINSEQIRLHMRTYYSLLRSSGTIQLETLVESHILMNSSLHLGVQDLMPDVSAMLYAVLRLPPCIRDIQEVLIGQTERSFIEAGYQDIADWERVYAPGRRRRMHMDGHNTMVVYIVSRSDIDDLVPILTAYQIEWNKLHRLLAESSVYEWLRAHEQIRERLNDDEMTELATLLQVDLQDLKRLEIVWRDVFIETLLQIARERKDIGIKLISGSLADYRRATALWWSEMRQTVLEAGGPDVEGRRLYFVSSNTHSLVNLLTGFARRHEEQLVDHVREHNYEQLLAEYEDVRAHPHKSTENFLYYVLGKLLDEGETHARMRRDERLVGIYRVPNKHGFEIEAQIIDMQRLRADWMDTRLAAGDVPVEHLLSSDALILNIDYPLGMAAYEMLSRITERISRIQGVYVMGKAATLNGRIGDVMIPNVIHDEHSLNTYLFENCFTVNDVRPYMTVGNVMDHQRGVTALGTFLQNADYMTGYYRAGYTDVEMETGPYLSAIYEAFRPKRHPVDEIVNLYNVPFDVGFLHYASDTPMKAGQNLGAGSLNYTGVEPTYATAIAILRRIFQRESLYLNERTIQSDESVEVPS